jgi:hypothetical protein
VENTGSFDRCAFLPEDKTHFLIFPEKNIDEEKRMYTGEMQQAGEARGHESLPGGWYRIALKVSELRGLWNDPRFAFTESELA